MPQAAPPPMPSATVPEKPKGAIGIWIGVLLIVGGIVLGIVLVVAGVKSFANGIDDLQTFPINGEGIARIEEPGSQSVYAERPSYGSSGFSSGTSFSGYGPNVAVRVIGPDGDDVSVDTSVSSETYTFNSREGVKIAEFDADVAGEYRVITRAQDSNGNWSRIAVGHAINLSGVGAIAGGIFGGGLVVLIGIIVVIIFAVRRSRSKKRIRQASNPYPGAYGGPGGGWPAAPGYAAPGAGYAAPGGGYAAPPAPTTGTWGSNPGWVPPPVPTPGTDAGGTWPTPPSPAAPDPGPTWQPPTAPPGAPPSAAAPPAPSGPPPSWTPPADPLAPSWQAPAPDPSPSSWTPPADPPAGEPPAPGGDPSTSS